MAGFGNMLAAQGGYASGRNQAYQDALARQLANAQLQVQQQNANNTTRLDNAEIAKYNADAAKDTATTNADATQRTKDQAFESALQLPKNWSKLDDGSKIAYLQQRINAAQRSGDDAIVKQTQDWIASIATGSEKEANADYTRGAKTYATNEKGNLDAQMPAILRARIDASKAIAQARLGADAERAAAGIAARQELAQFNANSRLGIAQLTLGYIYGQKLPFEAAVKAATTEYTQQMQTYRAQNTPAAQALNGGIVGTEPTLNLPAAPSMTFSPTISLTIDKDGRVVPISGGGASNVAPLRVGGGTNTTNNANPKADPAKVSALVSGAIKNGKSDVEIRAAAQAGGYDMRLINAAIAKLRAGGGYQPVANAPQPLPVIKGIAPQLLGQ